MRAIVNGGLGADGASPKQRLDRQDHTGSVLDGTDSGITWIQKRRSDRVSGLLTAEDWDLMLLDDHSAFLGGYRKRRAAPRRRTTRDVSREIDVR